MKKVGVAILGLGVVGGGTYKILQSHSEFYRKNYCLDIKVECVLETNRQKALDLGVDESLICLSIAEICSNPDVDIVVECMGGVDPAKGYLLSALSQGKSVVTSNKELYAKCGHELEKAARKYNCGLFYEATCVGGVPVIRTLLDNLQGNEITSIVGIINGTTNYILSKMASDGSTYETVLEEAQFLGYAEANPGADVEGYDSAYKLSILCSLAFHTKVPYDHVFREGITDISSTDIQYGDRLGYVLKLLAIGKNTSNGIEARVHPTFIRKDHPLANVNGSYNGVLITGDSVGDVMLYGQGAGGAPTGSAMVGDIIYCAMHDNYLYSPFNNSKDADHNVKFIDNFTSAYYIRVQALDKSGVLAKITNALSRQGISVAKMLQDDGANESVPMILITHPTHENNVKKAVEEITASADYAKVLSVIRVIS